MRHAGYQTENIMLYQTSWIAFTRILAICCMWFSNISLHAIPQIFYEIDITVFFQIIPNIYLYLFRFTIFCFVIWDNIMRKSSATMYTEENLFLYCNTFLTFLTIHSFTKMREISISFNPWAIVLFFSWDIFHHSAFNKELWKWWHKTQCYIATESNRSQYSNKKAF